MFFVECGKVLFSKAGVGCYKDLKNVLPLPELILTDRDPSSRAYSGQTIDWNNWDTYMPDFICRCAEKANEMKRTIFGLENYGKVSIFFRRTTLMSVGRKVFSTYYVFFAILGKEFLVSASTIFLLFKAVFCVLEIQFHSRTSLGKSCNV